MDEVHLFIWGMLCQAYYTELVVVLICKQVCADYKTEWEPWTSLGFAIENPISIIEEFYKFQIYF